MSSDRRRVLADAALEVLARDGSRGLTHRAVDAAAGLPAGSTSYYHRSRAALLQTCVQRLVEQVHAELDDLLPPARVTDAGVLAGALAALLHHWLTTDRQRHLARYELTMESVRRPELAAELHKAGRSLRDRTAETLGSIGVPDPDGQARWLVACLEGILFDSIVGAGSARPVDRDELRSITERLLAVVLPPGPDGPADRG